MPEFYLTIAGADYIASYDAKVTYEGAPKQGPSYASGGQPAEGPEFEIGNIRLREDLGADISTAPLDLPAWLEERIEAAIRDHAGADILQEHFEREQDDRDRAAEDRAEYRRDITRVFGLE